MLGETPTPRGNEIKKKKKQLPPDHAAVSPEPPSSEVNLDLAVACFEPRLNPFTCLSMAELQLGKDVYDTSGGLSRMELDKLREVLASMGIVLPVKFDLEELLPPAKVPLFRAA